MGKRWFEKNEKTNKTKDEKQKMRMICMESDQATTCPKCMSENVKIINMNYPKAYECEDCKYTFIKSRQALIDE